METLNEGKTLNKIKKGLKGAAIGAGVLGAAATGITGYGAVNGIRRANSEEAKRAMAVEEAKRAKDQLASDIAHELHRRGVEIKNDVKDFGNSAKCLQEVSKICKAYSNNPDDPEIDNRVQSCIDKYGVDAYSRSLQVIITGNDFANATKSTAKKLANKVKGKFGKKAQINEEFELIEEEVSVNKVEKKLAKMKKLLNKPRNTGDSSYRDFSASEKEKMLSLIAKVEKVLARNPKTEADIEKFQEDLEDTFEEFNNYSKACKAFKGISWWFLPLGYIPPLTRLYARVLRNLTNQRPIGEEVNYFPY